MLVLIRLALTIALLNTAITALAHNPLSARYQFQSNGSVGQLTVSLSQDGVNAALAKTYPKSMLDTLSSDAFKRLLIRYVKEHFILRADGEKIALYEGGIKLGNHQTDMRFVADPIRQEALFLDVAIAAFTENDGHQSIFSCVINGHSGRVILQAQNNYNAAITLNAHTSKENDTTTTLWVVAALAILLSIIYFIKYINRQKDNVKHVV